MAAAPIPYSYWLIDGLLLAGQYPGEYDSQDTREKIAKFLDAGIRTFINLTETREPLTPYEGILCELAKARGIETKHIRHPIQNRCVPRDREMMTAILAEIREELAAGRAVYVHCWGGIGRTGTVIGCWLVEEGFSGPDAIERIAELRKGMPDRFTRSPENDEQCRFVCEWKTTP